MIVILCVNKKNLKFLIIIKIKINKIYMINIFKNKTLYKKVMISII